MPQASTLMKTPESRFVGLFIGRSGGGKSTAAYSFPKPMKVLDLDGRIRGGLSNSWIDPTGIDYEFYPPRGGPNHVATYVKLDKDLETLLLMQNMPGVTPYKTLVLDSLTFEMIAFLLDAIPLVHAEGAGKKVGQMEMAGPAEYGFQATGTYKVMSFLRSLAIPNVIVTAHIIAKYGKAPGETNKFAPNVIIGEQLNMTDKLAEAIPSYFDHIYRFSKVENGGRSQYFVKTDGEMERSAYLSIPREADITGKDFYKWLMNNVKKEEVAA